MEEKKLTRQERAEQKAQKKARKKKGWLIALVVILAVVLVVVLAAAAVLTYFNSLLGLINRADDETVPTMSQEEYQQMLEEMQETIGEEYEGTVLADGESVDWGEDDNTVIESGDDVINILLIGQDRRSNQSRSRSDVIILCTVNKVAKTITLTSFMRDMYVQIPGYEDNRINVPYVLGGMDLLDRTLKTNFGVEVDGNVEVDFNGFVDIVNLMGGVDIELTAAEAKYMNKNHSFDVEGESGTWNLKEGMQHLTGSQALSYARMRYVGNGDYERTERQRRVLAQLIEKAKGLSISELNLILEYALPMITTDLDNAQIMGYALELFPMLKDLEINTKRIPVNGAYQSTYVNGMAVLVPDLAKNRAVLKEIMDTN